MNKCTSYRIVVNKPVGIQESEECASRAEIQTYLDTKAKSFPDGTKISVVEVTKKVISRFATSVTVTAKVNRVPEVKKSQV